MVGNEEADLQRANAELRRQLDERTEQQSATIDVLKKMSASPGDPQPVFDLIVRQARELCKTPSAILLHFDGELVDIRAMASGTVDWGETLERYKSNFPMAPTRSSLACRAILDAQIVHIRDLDAERGIAGSIRALGHKTSVTVPMVRDGHAIGAISTAAFEIDAFSASQVELLQTFAEQAVIALTSAETYRKLQQRTGDLQESLEYQTATSDVLKVISRSTFDLQSVLDTLVQTAGRLCAAEMAFIYRRDGEVYRLAANVGFPPDYEAFIRGLSIAPGRDSVTARAALERGEAAEGITCLIPRCDGRRRPLSAPRRHCRALRPRSAYSTHSRRSASATGTLFMPHFSHSPAPLQRAQEG